MVLILFVLVLVQADKENSHFSQFTTSRFLSETPSCLDSSLTHDDSLNFVTFLKFLLLSKEKFMEVSPKKQVPEKHVTRTIVDVPTCTPMVDLYVTKIPKPTSKPNSTFISKYPTPMYRMPKYPVKGPLRQYPIRQCRIPKYSISKYPIPKYSIPKYPTKYHLRKYPIPKCPIPKYPIPKYPTHKYPIPKHKS